ncbi:ERAP1-like C-terminal domain-containing protein [Rhizorhabdus wittichii]|uniref:Aminopeptidase n=1 Tax=Rhizorhabdus wittichii TaxID=160791 RepID=A0A975HE41_9SPHN|nr:M1 family metallopeptidase [Rhizorhabdus wittichii]QTH22081.1 ERAP1-like C-terminal domain-containing protein [Rhizorhabdus wittichii]
MKKLLAAVALAALSVPLSAAATTAEPVPLGILSDAATPLAYRLDLTIVPDRERFSGHAEIDATLKAETRSLFLHGRSLKVARVVARVGGRTVAARYGEVDGSGVARLDFASPLPAGKVTLVFDYDAAFGDGASGLYRVKVADQWYAWTQFESIDARAAFPGFDQPGYKTPFTVSLTTRPGEVAIGNSREVRTTKAGDLVRHEFEATKPLPTYLVAFAVGPFATATGSVSPTAERKEPLPIGIVGTQPYKDKLGYALENTGPIVTLLEKYFGTAFPFPKLDQIGSPVMPGAMENAGADIYGDTILLLDRGASTDQKKTFGMVVAHELSHQWFGDLVTPAWWDDLWLNESFANWMGYRIGNEWRPDLKIGAGAIDEAFGAMNVDALKAGRPIHQPIKTNGEIDSAFDQVTYGKGGQVVAMIAAYLGDEKFRDGVRLHLNRYAYGNATTDQFFGSLADASHDPRVLESLRSFVDQQGVPVVRVERTATGLSVAQKRYALLGTQLPQQSWIIPLCVRVGESRDCTLLDKPSGTVPITAKGAIVPNAGGTGYYRFSLPEAEWKTLIAEAASLPPGEALALTDSLWAGFRAGEVAPALLLDAARAMAANDYSVAAVDGGLRLAGLRQRGMIAGGAIGGYRAFMADIYRPKLAAIGFDPRTGLYADDDGDRQKLRADLVSLVAGEAGDKALIATLATAAKAWLGGDKAALDQAFFGAGLGAYLADGGDAAVAALFEKAVTSDDTLFRDSAIGALASTDSASAGRWLLDHLGDKRLRSGDRTALIQYLALEPATRDMAYQWMIGHYAELVKNAGIFVASQLPSVPVRYCSAEKAAAVEAALRPEIVRYQRGALALDRTVEQINSCGVLEAKRGGEIAAMFAGK